MALTLILFAAAAALLAVMTAAWVLALRLGNAGWVDTVWTLALGAVAAAAALTAGSGARAWIAAGGIALWSLRLGLHLARRTSGKPEDSRYAAMRREWGLAYPRKLLIFLYIQALAAFLLLLAPLFAARNPAALGWPDYAAILVLAAAIAGEAVADRQLQRFRDDPASRGMVCDQGLWSVSRHPNYFFEWLGWCGYPLLAIRADYPEGLLALAGPVLMYALLVHVSGIPPLESQMLESRGQRYRDYQQRTRAFFPIPRQP